MKRSSALKVMTVVGTRPEIIRLSRIIPLLDDYTDHILVHTGQNYDYELNQIFFEELELRKPDHFLEIDTTSLGSSVGDIIRKSEKILLEEKPDALLVLGDTNSCLSAYMAKRMHIPIFHMEAGNRCFDFNVPEEVNRRIIDHIADINLVYTEHARRHLISEGLPHNRIYLTGSPMKEVIDHNLEKIRASQILQNFNLKKNGYFLISIHREENVDNKNQLEKLTSILNLISDLYKIPVIVTTHPRTRKRLDSSKNVQYNDLIHFMSPFGFLDYVHLQMNAMCVVSDSGTISEEAAILSFPAVTLRQSMERPEAMETGNIILTGFTRKMILNSIELVIKEFKQNHVINPPIEYKIDNTSWRVLKTIISLASVSNKWWGIAK